MDTYEERVNAAVDSLEYWEAQHQAVINGDDESYVELDGKQVPTLSHAIKLITDATAYQGQWEPVTLYDKGMWVFDDDRYLIATETHTSNADIEVDIAAGRIKLAVDLSASVDAAATSASNAATSESNAATSESNAATSESNAATSESNAATSASEAASAVARKEFDGGVAFNGVNTYAKSSVVLAGLFDGGGTFSLKATLPESGQYWRYYDCATTLGGWALFINGTSGQLQFNHYTSGTVLATGCDIPATLAGNVVDINIVFDGSVDSSSPIIYFNGEVQSMDALTTASGELGIVGSTTEYIGCRTNVTEILEGSLSNLVFFNFALSSDQIVELSEIGTGAFLAKYPELKWGGEFSGTPQNGEGGRALASFSVISDTEFQGTTQDGFDYAGYWIDVVEGQTIRVTSACSLVDGGGIPPTVMHIALRTSTSDSIYKSNFVDLYESLDSLETVEIIPTETGRWFMSWGTNGTATIMTISDISITIEGCTSYLPMQDGGERILVDKNPANLPAVIQGDYEHLKTKADTDEVLLADYTLDNVTATTGIALNALQDDLCSSGKQVTRTEIFYESGDMLGCYLEAEKDSDGSFEQVTLTKTITKAKDALGVINDTSELEDSFSLWLRGNLLGATARIKVYGR